MVMFARVFALTGAVLAVLIGATVQGIPSRLGFFRWIARKNKNDRLVGWMPAFAEWNYTYAQLNDEVGEQGLAGQNVIVTGANSGIGYWTALHLARLGADVVLACRNPKKCQTAAKSMADHIGQNSKVSLECRTLDTSSQTSVRTFASQFQKPLHILVLNAGISGDPDNINDVSEDGLPLVLATNHVGHQLLYELLLPRLLEGAQDGQTTRVVLTSSAAHYNADKVPLSKADFATGSFYERYGRSKLANILCAREATRQLKEMAQQDERATRVHVNAMHPGVVDTNIFQALHDKAAAPEAGVGVKVLSRVLAWMQTKHVLWTAEEGALTLLFLSASPAIPKFGIQGRYYHPQGVEAIPCTKFVGDDEEHMHVQRKFWKFTQSLYKPE